MPSPPVPQHCPTPVELDDLELLTMGAVPGIDGFNQPDSPLTLRLPDPVAQAADAAGAVELVDPEGLPLARVTWPEGTVEPLVPPRVRPVPAPPAQPRTVQGGVRRPHGRPGHRRPHGGGAGPSRARSAHSPCWPWWARAPPTLSPVALTRATLAAAALLARRRRRHRPPRRPRPGVPGPGRRRPTPTRWLRRALCARLETSQVKAPTHPTIAAIVDADRPPNDERGLVLFFTGLSGSGKSTLARALVDRLLEQGRRTVTSLDGDVVRRHLSAGLTFSKEDRETNIRRIGWVAAEIARHGGVAVVSPIAPFDETRQQVRAMVDEAGGAFFLIHVATPLEECERRDRKGLYAKARAGEIPEFTGISSPYEEPQDADVRVDTTGRTIEDALEDVLAVLRDDGYLDLSIDA